MLCGFGLSLTGMWHNTDEYSDKCYDCWNKWRACDSYEYYNSGNGVCWHDNNCPLNYRNMCETSSGRRRTFSRRFCWPALLARHMILILPPHCRFNLDASVSPQIAHYNSLRRNGTASIWDDYSGGTCFPAELNFYAICAAFCGLVCLWLLYLRYRTVSEEEKATTIKPAPMIPVIAGIYCAMTTFYAIWCSAAEESHIIAFQWTILPLNLILAARCVSLNA